VASLIQPKRIDEILGRGGDFFKLDDGGYKIKGIFRKAIARQRVGTVQSRLCFWRL
jgi:hypothetical protein